MKYKNKRRMRTFIWCSVLSLILVIIIIFTESNVRPIMLEVAINDAQAVNERIINNAVYDALTEDEINFDDLINISYDENGETYECAIKPARKSDKTLLDMIVAKAQA